MTTLIENLEKSLTTEALFGDNPNFRITTDYILQWFNITTQLYHTVWCAGVDGKVQYKVAAIGDSTSTALEIVGGVIPNGLPESNYRITADNVIQLANTTTKKWNTPLLSGIGSSITFRMSQIGEN